MVDASNITVVLDKLFYYSYITGFPCLVDPIIKLADDTFNLGTIAHGTGNILILGLKIFQLDDMPVSIDGDEKLTAIDTMPITRSRRRDTM